MLNVPDRHPTGIQRRIMSFRPPRRGVNDPSRSLGTFSRMGPTSDSTVFGVVPLRIRVFSGVGRASSRSPDG